MSGTKISSKTISFNNPGGRKPTRDNRCHVFFYLRWENRIGFLLRLIGPLWLVTVHVDSESNAKTQSCWLTLKSRSRCLCQWPFSLAPWHPLLGLSRRESTLPGVAVLASDNPISCHFTVNIIEDWTVKFIMMMTLMLLYMLLRSPRLHIVASAVQENFAELWVFHFGSRLTCKTDIAVH